MCIQEKNSLIAALEEAETAIASVNREFRAMDCLTKEDIQAVGVALEGVNDAEAYGGDVDGAIVALERCLIDGVARVHAVYPDAIKVLKEAWAVGVGVDK